MSAKNLAFDFVAAISFRRNLASSLLASFALCLSLSSLSHAVERQPVTDDVFVREAFVSARTEILLSQIALEKSQNSGVKKVAKVIIKDNNSANDQLRSLADARKLAVPTLLDKDNQEQIDQLKSIDKENLDTTYRGKIQQTHGAAIELFDRVAKNPRADAELRVFATQRLALYKKHSQMIDKLKLASPKAIQQQASR